MKLSKIIICESERVGGRSDVSVFGVSNKNGVEPSTRITSEDLSAYKIIRHNSFVYNPYRINVGSIGLFKGEIGAVSPAYVTFSVDENQVIPELLLAYLKSGAGLRNINRNTSGTVRKTLSLTSLGEIELGLPSIDIQRSFFSKLSNSLGEFAKLADVNREINQKISSLRSSILQDAIQGKLVPQDPADEPAAVLLERIRKEKEDLAKVGKIKKQKELPPISPDEVPFELPKGWEWVRLGMIGSTQTGTTPRTDNPDFFNGNWSFIKPGDISPDGNIDYHNESLSDLGARESRIIESESILMVCIGGSTGKCGLVDRKVCCNQQINTITPSGMVLPKYVLTAMKSPYFYGTIWQSNYGLATPIISKGKWELIPIPIPPFTEQSRIVAKVNELMADCDKLESLASEASEKSEKLLESVLGKVFAQ